MSDPESRGSQSGDEISSAGGSKGGPESPRQGGLGKRFLVGSMYLGVSNWLTYALNFATQILIARMLGPEDFGLYAFVRAIYELLSIVGAFSLGAALVQSRDESQRLYDTALAICIGLGLVGLVAAGAIAPLLWMHRAPVAAWFLIVMSLCRILLLASHVPHAKMERALRYGPISAIGMVTGNVPNGVALALAWTGLGAWCLVIRDVLVALLTLVLETAWSGYRFRGKVERRAASSLMRFSRPMFFSRSVLVLLQRIDNLAVGAFFGNAATGLYHQARFLSEAGVLATRPLSQLSFNLYARVREEPPRLARSFEIVNYFLIRVIFAGAVVLLVYPDETLRVLLGDEWLEASPLLRWLGLYAGLLPVFMNLRQLFNGLGEVMRNVRINLLQLLVFAPAVLAACLAGSLNGVAAGLLGSTLLGLSVAWWYSGDLVERRPLRLLATPAAAVAVTVAGFLGAAAWLEAVPWYLRPLLPPLSFLAIVLAVERTTLIREVGYLMTQLRGARGGSAAVPEA
jgi:PST family polysaccharide transporter